MIIMVVMVTKKFLVKTLSAEVLLHDIFEVIKSNKKYQGV